MVDKLHTKYVLDETEMPRAWYNILPDLPRPLAPRAASRAPSNPSRQTISRRCSRWRSSCRR